MFQWILLVRIGTQPASSADAFFTGSLYAIMASAVAQVVYSVFRLLLFRLLLSLR